MGSRACLLIAMLAPACASHPPNEDRLTRITREASEGQPISIEDWDYLCISTGNVGLPLPDPAHAQLSVLLMAQRIRDGR